MGRKPCCAKEGLNRGTWTARENKILANYINIHGEGKWRDLPLRAGLKRCGKSCRLRWMNYLRPDVKRGNISEEEEELIIKLHNLLGNRWSLIAGRLPGRTDNEIKNYWNTKFRKSKGGWKNQNPIKSPFKLWGKDSKSIKLPGTETELHKVIRTKAVRCTKVVLPQKLNNPVPEPKEVPTCDPIESPNSFSPPLLDQHHSPNFSMDFDINKILISDVLNDSEFHVPGFEALQRNYSSDETMQESWKERDQTVQPNEVLDLKTIASFFNSEGEWTI